MRKGERGDGTRGCSLWSYVTNCGNCLSVPPGKEAAAAALVSDGRGLGRGGILAAIQGPVLSVMEMPWTP